MEDAKDLLPSDIVIWLLENLRQLRLSNGHGSLHINVQHGHISGVNRLDSKKYPFKDSKDKA